MRKLTLVTLLSFSVLLFSGWMDHDPSKKAKKIPASEQRQGDPEKGLEYLLTGNYVNSGIPYEIFSAFNRPVDSVGIKREGLNANLAPQFNAIAIDDTTNIVAPNCLTCHSDYINGQFVIGLGNTSFDYTMDLSKATPILSMTVLGKYGNASSEWKAFQAFKKASEKINPHIKTEVRGINPADQLTAALVAHRDPETLMWSDTAILDIPARTIPTDVPPWWVLKKKHAMFYTGIGRGDFSKFLMASSLLTLQDTSEARKIDEHFPDVLSWINSLEAPQYPFDIDQEKVLHGKRLFELNCEKCHGRYGEEESYPNFLVPLKVVGTDATLSDSYTSSTYNHFIDWYNKSWFSKGKNAGTIVAEGGYVAQPLDGIWASAPYWQKF